MPAVLRPDPFTFETEFNVRFRNMKVEDLVHMVEWVLNRNPRDIMINTRGSELSITAHSIKALTDFQQEVEDWCEIRIR